VRYLFSLFVCSWIIAFPIISSTYAMEKETKEEKKNEVTLEATIEKFRKTFLSLQDNIKDWPDDAFSFSDEEFTTLGLDPVKVDRQKWKLNNGEKNLPLHHGMAHIIGVASEESTKPILNLETLWKKAILNGFVADLIAKFGSVAEEVEVEPRKFVRKVSPKHKEFTHSFEHPDFEMFSSRAASYFLRIGGMFETDNQLNAALDSYSLGILMLRLPILYWQPVGKLNIGDPRGKLGNLHFQSTGLTGVELFDAVKNLIANHGGLQLKNMSRLYFYPFATQKENLLGAVLWQIQFYEWAGEAEDQKAEAAPGEYYFPFAEKTRLLYEQAGSLAEAYANLKKGAQRAHAFKEARGIYLGLCWSLKKRKQNTDAGRDKVTRVPLSAWSDIHDSSEGDFFWLKVIELSIRAHQEYKKAAEELISKQRNKLEAADLYFAGIHMLIRLPRTPSEGLVQYLQCYNLVQEGIKLFTGVDLSRCTEFFEDPYGDIRYPLGRSTKGENLAQFALNRIYNSLWARFAEEMEISFKDKATQSNDQITQEFLSRHQAAFAVLDEGYKNALHARLTDELEFQRKQAK